MQYNLNQSKYAVGVPAGNFDLVYEVNQVIDRFRATPQYADLMREYLSSASEVFTRPIAGRKTYTVKAGDTLSKIAAGAAEGLEPLARDLGSQPRPRGQREPDLPAARAADALTPMRPGAPSAVRTGRAVSPIATPRPAPPAWPAAPG